MKSAIKKIFVLAGCVLLFVTSMRAQRACLNLSETLWNITLDRSAVWQNDSLYVPPVNIHDLPVHIPTGGWNLLDTPEDRGDTSCYRRATPMGMEWRNIWSYRKLCRGFMV